MRDRLVDAVSVHQGEAAAVTGNSLTQGLVYRGCRFENLDDDAVHLGGQAKPRKRPNQPTSEENLPWERQSEPPIGSERLDLPQQHAHCSGRQLIFSQVVMRLADVGAAYDLEVGVADLLA